MKKSSLIFPLLLLLTLCIGTSKATNIESPDFAFPEKVTKQAEKDLNEAMKTGDGTATVNALVRYGIAQNLIDDDNLETVVKKIESIEEKENNAITKSLLNTLLIEIYNGIYSAERRIFNEREIPLQPYPAKISEWSKDQFKLKINELITKALSPSHQLQSEPISKYASIIESDRLSQLYYPTLYDFTAYRAIKAQQNLNNGNYELGEKWLSPDTQFIGMASEYLPNGISSIIAIYQGLAKFHQDNSAAKISSCLNRLDFVNNHIGNYVSTKEQPYTTALFTIFDQNRENPNAGLILSALGSKYLTIERQQQYVKIASEFLAKNPECENYGNIKYHINRIMTPSVSVNVPSLTAPGHSTTGRISGNNANSVTLNFYRINDSYTNDFWTTTDTNNATLSFTQTVAIEGEAPFEIDKEFQFTLPTVGKYAIVATAPGINEKPERVSVISCTNLAISPISTLNYNEIVVIDPISGKPVKDVTVMTKYEKYSPTGYIDIVEPLAGLTDKDGIKTLDKKQQEALKAYSLEIFPSKGNDKFSPSTRLYRHRNPNSNKNCQILTDLPIYHPGDTIQAVVILYNQEVGKNYPLVNKETTLILRDANSNEIATVKGYTDKWGRMETKFAIPTTGLTGNFRIQAKGIGSTNVMVSDYKMPTFEVSAEQISSQPSEPIKFKGKVKTYAGFPLSDSKVTLTLTNSNPWRWWMGGGNSNSEFYSLISTTDGNGEFTFSIPQELLANAPMPAGLFTATFSAVSPSGETQSSSNTFVNKKQYIIQANTPAAINALEPQQFDINVYGNDGKKIDLAVKCTVVKDTTIITTFDLSKDGTVKLDAIPSGCYKLRFALADSSLTSTPTENEIVIYRPNDKNSPVNKPIWVAKNSVNANNGKASILYAVAEENTLVYYIATGYNGVTTQKGWLKPKKGMNRLEITVPEGEKLLNVAMFAARNLQFSNISVNVNTPKSLDNLQITVETFRDKVLPQSQERLTLTVKDSQGNPASTAVVLDMFNKALTQLAPHSLNFTTRDIYTPKASIGSTLNQIQSYSISNAARYVSPKEISIPMFNLYGYEFGNYHGRNPLFMKALLFSAQMRNDKATGSIIPLAAASLAVNEDETASENDKGEPTEEEFAYRNAETALSFFRPMLATDENGRIEFSYIVPNANATWMLGALVYNNEMLTSYTTREQIASKPVMVQPNLPRFVRMGDQIVIPANVMNATDSLQEVTTTFEIFDPATGETFKKETSTISVPANGSIIAKISIEIPFDMTMIGYRVKSATDNWADGEQGIIPVLESVEPVIKSKPFYIAPDSMTFSMQLPNAIPDGKSTLQFCENPTWYIVTALPGLRSKTDRTANSAAAAIFSAAIADGILKSNPTIKNAIHQWLNSDKSDSTLVSMLERNQDMKIALLSATPWMLDARSDSERMSRLALLFDKKAIKDTYDTNINALAKLQRHGGGWAWISEFNTPSYSTTLNILEMMGDLKRLGYLPDNKSLNSMIENAVTYIDRETANRYKKYSKGDYSLYVAVRDLHSDIKQSTAAKRVTDATIQRLVANWKSLQVTDKAIAALILNNHSYAATARNIIKSLNEYSKSSSERGMWWPQLDRLAYSRYSKIGATAIILDAYTAVNPSAKEIDKIRQWIIIEKEAQDWKQGVITSQVIASMLSSGSNWIKPAAGATISINGETLNAKPIDQTLGYYRENISEPAKNGGSMQIVKHGEYPSWGAIFNQGRMTMNRIAAVSIEDLSIEKHLYRAVATSDGTQWEETDNYKVGDRLKVDLLIKVGREMDYVAIVDNRAACLEPVEQLPTPIVSQGIYFYRENRDAATNIFIDRLPKGTYRLSYEMTVNNAGKFSAGTATIQSQYAPSLTAHSSGAILTVEE